MLQPLVASPPVVDWALVALAVWLVGALVFLVVRFSRYFAMRGELLAAGTQVGEREGVRLVETAATPARRTDLTMNLYPDYAVTNRARDTQSLP